MIKVLARLEVLEFHLKVSYRTLVIKEKKLSQQVSRHDKRAVFVSENQTERD